MVTHMRNLAIWLTTLLLVAGPVLSGAGVVLCMGADGHVAVETVCKPCCTEGKETCCTLPPEDGHEQHDDCVNCTDSPLDGYRWTRRPSFADLPVAHLAELPVVGIPPESETTRAHSLLILRSDPTTGDLSLVISLATTVLRC
jgi:hypothetical protein